MKGQWLAQEFAICISRLTEADFKVEGKVTDNNQLASVNAFTILLNENNGDKQHFIVVSGTETIFFLFFDSVHLIKEISGTIYSALRKLCFHGSSPTFVEFF